MKPKICVSIPAYSTEKTLNLIKLHLDTPPDLFEIRLDFQKKSLQLQKIRNETEIEMIATFRHGSEGGNSNVPEKKRLEILKNASKIGFNLVDISITTENIFTFVEEIKKLGSHIIISYHDYQDHITNDQLTDIDAKARSLRADIVKIIGSPQSIVENIDYLNHVAKNPASICFGMGDCGVISRVMSPLFGGLHTYASADIGRECAPGQLSFSELREIYSNLGVID